MYCSAVIMEVESDPEAEFLEVMRVAPIEFGGPTMIDDPTFDTLELSLCRREPVSGFGFVADHGSAWSFRHGRRPRRRLGIPERNDLLPDRALPYLGRFLPGLVDRSVCYWQLLTVGLEDNDFRFATAMALTARNLGRNAVAAIGLTSLYIPLQGWSHVDLFPGEFFELAYRLGFALEDNFPKYRTSE